MPFEYYPGVWYFDGRPPNTDLSFKVDFPPAAIVALHNRINMVIYDLGKSFDKDGDRRYKDGHYYGTDAAKLFGVLNHRRDSEPVDPENISNILFGNLIHATVDGIIGPMGIGRVPERIKK